LRRAPMARELWAGAGFDHAYNARGEYAGKLAALDRLVRLSRAASPAYMLVIDSQKTPHSLPRGDCIRLPLGRFPESGTSPMDRTVARS